jgi:hypothetical protein
MRLEAANRGKYGADGIGKRHCTFVLGCFLRRVRCHSFKPYTYTPSAQGCRVTNWDDSLLSYLNNNEEWFNPSTLRNHNNIQKHTKSIKKISLAAIGNILFSYSLQ